MSMFINTADGASITMVPIRGAEEDGLAILILRNPVEEDGGTSAAGLLSLDNIKALEGALHSLRVRAETRRRA